MAAQTSGASFGNTRSLFVFAAADTAAAAPDIAAAKADAAVGEVTSIAGAALPSAAPSPPVSSTALTAFARCTIVSTDEASRLLGYDVLAPDTTARAGGNCFFTSQAMSQDGSVAYALVTATRLVALRPYFVALARRCAGVVASSPRAAACALYAKLATVKDVDGYYTARTSLPDAAPVPGFRANATSVSNATSAMNAASTTSSTVRTDDTSAMSAGGTIFLRYGGAVVEAAVRRDGSFDVERSAALARLLLERLALERLPN